ncbi:hypothetical protein ACIOHE_26365 [Streptomyces sp. NPDC087851]|uniref:hypothetical protein n=1 Tax=Streptomyces sp. NPDC087851 TaxID=3365810 RepID=UPI00381118EB
MATWIFRPPTVAEGPAARNRLFIRLKLDRGISILEGPPGAYRAVRFPTQDEIAASQPHMFMGGHEYEVDDVTRAALLAAPIGVTDANFTLLTDEPAPAGYGSGGYGSGPYGG